MPLSAYYDLPEQERGQWEARWELKREECQFCGVLREECMGEDHEWFPQMDVHYGEMAEAAANWMWESRHENAPYHDGSFANWSKDRSATFPFHMNDGVRIWVSRENLTPDDDFI